MDSNYNPTILAPRQKTKLPISLDWQTINWIGVSMWCLPAMLLFVSAQIYNNTYSKTDLDFAIASIWQYMLLSVIVLGLLHSCQSRKLTALPLAFYAFWGAVLSLSSSLQHQEPVLMLVLAAVLIATSCAFIYNDKSREMASWAVSAAAVYFIGCNIYDHCCSLCLHRLLVLH